MKIYQINASGNALILMKIDGDQIEILNGIDGWGHNIKENITVEELKEE